ncbi:MAG: 3-dehydroquinate synthase [Flavobacteriaceae bacterium]|nr:3-dehydroquinate synthase [Flavobacteriaceae bacterium]MDG2313923.1 3-dehydroquinate synthase [Flavobacteriaceae bacterium]
MKSIQSHYSFVHFESKGYESLNALLKNKQYSKLFVLVDTNTHEHCLSVFLEQLERVAIEIIEIEAGEEHKHLDTCMGVWEALSELGADRKSLLMNLGGGVVTDLGGFVACTFKRGIDYVNIPTTLLSMVDASVGGKTGVDLGNLKNQIGVISEPQMVLVDPNYLSTLPDEEVRSGYAEMLKHGLIADLNYWNTLKDYKSIHSGELLPLIHRSIEIKNKVVTEDPREDSIRKTLNFGHTLGHAIESHFLSHPSKKKLLHGEAIAIGMVLAGYLSHHLCGFSKEYMLDIKSVMHAIYPKVDIATSDIAPIIELMKYDKKNAHGSINFILLKDIGVHDIDITVDNELIYKAFQFYLD